MINVTIRTPIWKNKSVGIADRQIVDDILVEITYKNVKGERLYPGKYFMKMDRADHYPTMTVKGTKLRIIPIADFEIWRESDA